MSILLKNIRYQDKKYNILISKGIIQKMQSCDQETKDYDIELDPKTESIDCSNKVAIPAFINMHTHSAMTLMRGMQEDVCFHDWIHNIWKMEEKVNKDFVYYGTKIAALEMIKTGTSVFNDQYWYHSESKRACQEMGIRPILSYVVLDQGDKQEAERQKEQCQKKYEDSLSWSDDAIFQVAFHAIYSVSEEMIVWVSDFAKKHNLNLHIHLSETEKEVNDCKSEHKGLSPVEYLDSLGVLNENLVAAHCLWLSDRDIELLGKNRVNCVHNINSNMKLTSGYKFRYQELKEAGANICIGTDGCASSNNLDMLESMKTSALMQKAWRFDPKIMPINELIELATINGAKALKLNSGELAEGKDADIAIVNTDSSFFLSPARFWANMIYSAHSDSIESLIARGKFVMRDRQVMGEEQILNEVKNFIKTL